MADGCLTVADGCLTMCPWISDLNCITKVYVVFYFSSSHSGQMCVAGMDWPLQTGATQQIRIQSLAVITFDLKIMAILCYTTNSASPVR